MMDDLTAGLDGLREYIPALDKAWYTAQVDEDQDDPSKQHLYRDAAARSGDAVQVLSAMAAEAAHSLPDGLDAGDREGLRWAVTQGEASPALAFYLECYEAIATFRFWAAGGDFGPALDRVALRAVDWLAPMSDTERHALGTALRDAKARAAEAELAQRGQQRGNTRRQSDARARAHRAWAAFGLDGPSGLSLLARVKKASDAQLAALADVYGYADVGAFMDAALDKGSSTRKALQRDSKH